VLEQHVTQHEVYSFSHVTTECLRPAHQLQAPNAPQATESQEGLYGGHGSTPILVI
jgi:hypothetical protein